MSGYYNNVSIEAFAAHLRESEKAAATVEKYVRDVRAFFDYLSTRHCEPVTDVTGVAIRSLSKEAVIAYKTYLLDRYAVRSVNSVIASLNAFFSFIGREDLKLRTLKVQRSVFLPQEKELTQAEFDRLCAAAEREGDRRLYFLLQTLGGTGMRVSELPFITVEAVAAGYATVTLKGKTRTVFLVKPLQKKLRRYIREAGITSGAVFVTRTGKPIDRTNIWREMKKLCREARVDPRKVFPHNLRHLFARVFYAVKKDIAKLADILGHSSIETTRIYIATTDAEYRRSLEKMRLVV